MCSRRVVDAYLVFNNNVYSGKKNKKKKKKGSMDGFPMQTTSSGQPVREWTSTLTPYVQAVTFTGAVPGYAGRCGASDEELDFFDEVFGGASRYVVTMTNRMMVLMRRQRRREQRSATKKKKARSALQKKKKEEKKKKKKKETTPSARTSVRLVRDGATGRPVVADRVRRLSIGPSSRPRIAVE